MMKGKLYGYATIYIYYVPREKKVSSENTEPTE